MMATEPNINSCYTSPASPKIVVARSENTTAMDIDPLEEPLGTASQNISASTTSQSSKRIEDLPNELLCTIIGYLDTPRPSASALHDIPTFETTSSRIVDLKNTSCLSKRWREMALPILLKHARLILRNNSFYQGTLAEQVLPFLKFARTHKIDIQSLVLLVPDDKIAQENPSTEVSDFWRVVFDWIDPAEVMIVATAEALGVLSACSVFMDDACFFNSRCQCLLLKQDSSLLEPNNVPESDSMVSSHRELLTIEHPHQTPLAFPQISRGNNYALKNTNETTLSSLKPPIMALAPLELNNMSEAAALQQRKTIPMPNGQELDNDLLTIFDIRPWTFLLLNEGSFIKAYAAYEFWLKQPPSILPDLVEPTSGKPRLSQTIVDFEYISVFPFTTHFSCLTANCPRVDRLFVQIVPRDGFVDPRHVDQIETDDLWMERNGCYSQIIRELFNTPPADNFRYLKVFESGDAADIDAWNMALEYVKRTRNGWNVEAPGVLVRTPKAGRKKSEESGTAATFEGDLERWAWNGTTRLPVSSFSLYDQPFGPADPELE